MKIVKNIQKLSHEIVVYAKDGRKSHLTLHWSAENVKIDKTNFGLRNTIPLHGMNKWRAMIYGSCLNADKHSPASSARSTKRWVSGMLMSVGVESSHWQIAKRLRSWASSEADCECPLYLSQGIRSQIFFATFVKNIETHIKTTAVKKALNQLIHQQVYHL